MKHFYTFVRQSCLLLLLLAVVNNARAQAPTISVQPASTSVCAGSTAFFFVSASGGTLTYQWQLDQGTGFADISGATNFSYTTPSTTAAMNGFLYRVKVTNSSGTTISSSATLTVRTAPVVNTNPSSTSVCAGNSASFSITASGSGTLGYQWQVSTGGPFSNVPASAPYSGGTTATLTINPTAAGMNGNVYQCVVTAVSGGCTPAATSNTAVLTVNSAAAITTGPSNSTVCSGTGTSFSVTATGTSITYQWQLSTDGGTTWNNVPASSPYSGTTSATLTLSTTNTSMDNYRYRCIVTSSVCSPAVTSTAAILNVTALPAITSNPLSVTQCAGPGTSFTVAASGAGLTYQWQISTDGGATWNNLTAAGAYSGVTTTTLTLSFTNSGMNGNRYRCVVSGTCSPSATSTAAILTINSSPAITTGPTNTTVCPGTNAAFMVVATGAGLTYQWQVSTGGPFTNVPASAPYSGTTSSTLSISPATVSMSGYQYRVVITGSCTPPVTSTAGTLSFWTPVSTSNPVNATTCVNVATSFSVTASGTGGYSYQWQVSTDGGSTWNNVPAAAPYTGTTSATLGITTPTVAMSGYQYRCQVSGFCSPPPATSGAATLTVNPSASVTSQPRDTAGCPGTIVTYTVVAGGTSPFTYQWQISTNGGGTWSNVPAAAPYSGTTTATLTINTINATMNGYRYRCIITGACAPAVISNSALLTLFTAPAITASPVSNAVCAGSADSFQVTATGTGLTYQWQLSTNGGITYSNVPAAAPYSGTTTNKLKISPVTVTMNTYRYRCIVSGTCSPPATSGAAILTVNTSPTITTQPINLTLCQGNNGTFSVIATGTALTYQWQYYNTATSTWTNVPAASPYSGTTTATLTITGATVAMDGLQYRVVVSGTCNPGVISNVATLTVNSVPSVTTQPVDATVCAGTDTSFSITATGTGITYQWQVSSGGPFSSVPASAPYSGTTTNRLVITGATAAMNNYQYRCLVSGTCAPPALSNAATLTVNTSPAITTPPANITVCDNGTPTFTVVATGAGLTYQWQENSGFGWANVPTSAPYIGGTTATLSITGVTLAMNGFRYRCIVAGRCAPSVISAEAILDVTTNTAWTGAISSDWSEPGNWACNTVPSATTNVTIPSVAPNMPLVNIPNAICDSMIIQAGASVAFTGAFNMLEIKGSIINLGTFDGAQGKTKFSGVGQQWMPSSTYFDLELASAGDKVISGGGDIRILDSLTLINGYLVLGAHHAHIGPLAGMYGGNGTSYILTNGTGKLISEDVGAGAKSGDNLIPIGAYRDSYTPMIFNNSGTVDTFVFWVYSACYKYYFNDVPTTVTINEKVVDRSWIVQEYNKGGSNVTMTLQWNASNELPGFDRNSCYMSHYFGKWVQGATGPAQGTGPYTVTMSGITSFSPFGVGSGDSPLPVTNVSGNENVIVIYPNPVTGSVLYVKFANKPAQDMTIRIADVVGKTWKEHINISAISNGILPVDVSVLPQGVYMLQVIDANGTSVHTVRFVKE